MSRELRRGNINSIWVWVMKESLLEEVTSGPNLEDKQASTGLNPSSLTLLRL